MLTTPPQVRVEVYRWSHFKVDVYIKEEDVNGMYSLVMQSDAYRQSDDTRLSSCLHDPMLLHSKRCATLVFERTLRDTFPHSCFFPEVIDS